METELQNKYRSEVMAKYQSFAFEHLGLYDYYGEQYSVFEKSVDELSERMGKAADQVREIESAEDWHTLENKEKAKALKKDCQDFQKQIDGITEMSKKFWSESVKHREEGVRCLEIAEKLRNFKMRTPEEIEAAKNQ